MPVTRDGRAAAPSSESSERRLPETVVERACKLLAAAALVVLLVLVGVDIASRSIFNFSFEVADEVGAYMLVAIAFLGLSVSFVNGNFHHVQLVQARLSSRGRAASRIVFNLVALLTSLAMLWQFLRFVLSSWRSGDRAPTFLETPLWQPRLLLVLGMLALCFSLCRALAADLRRLRNSSDPGRRRQ